MRVDRGEGPIPAHAGQPWPQWRPRPVPRAYPRSRGATVAGLGMISVGMGLSPLTRGNRLVRVTGRHRGGPIPAHAGQPRYSLPFVSAHSGLSPLTRGNLRRLAWQELQIGPIPAHAGQPFWPICASRWPGAYPRSRGATCRILCRPRPRLGLSPLTRGNRQGKRVGGAGLGPIPAHAGQPACRFFARCRGRAYPRSRGATR